MDGQLPARASWSGARRGCDSLGCGGRQGETGSEREHGEHAAWPENVTVEKRVAGAQQYDGAGQRAGPVRRYSATAVANVAAATITKPTGRGGRVRTWVALTSGGRRSYATYVATLRDLIGS
jgi:hypothetical protein